VLDPRPLALSLGLLAVVAIGRPALAESSLRLELPDHYGRIPASTYDEGGERVGGAEILIEERGIGKVALEVESGIEGAERTVASADLIRVDGGEALQIVAQHSRSIDAEGNPLGVLSIDHVAGIGSCTPPPSTGKKAETLRLPSGDRVANVPLNLLFRPLARGETQELSFQIFVCRFGPRLFDAVATVARRAESGDGEPEKVEVRYELEIPGYLAAIARPFLPRVAMWFDAGASGDWIGHRMPLFSKGPTVLVMRSGTSPNSLFSAF
jgi:hypothetical protein